MGIETTFAKGKVLPIGDLVAYFDPEFWLVALEDAGDVPLFFEHNGWWAERIRSVSVRTAPARVTRHYNFID